MVSNSFRLCDRLFVHVCSRLRAYADIPWPTQFLIFYKILIKGDHLPHTLIWKKTGLHVPLLETAEMDPDRICA